MKPATQKIFFQTQSTLSSDCGVCVINNMLGSKIYSNHDLNKICKQISNDFINPYKSIFGGDYDITAIIIGFQKLGLNVRWMKNNQQFGTILSSSTLQGILLNTKTQGNKIFNKLFQKSGRHWTCLKKTYQNEFVFLDSLKKQPKIYKDKNEAQIHLYFQKQHGGIFLIVDNLPQNQRKSMLINESKIIDQNQ